MAHVICQPSAGSEHQVPAVRHDAILFKPDPLMFVIACFASRCDQDLLPRFARSAHACLTCLG